MKKLYRLYSLAFYFALTIISITATPAWADCAFTTGDTTATYAMAIPALRLQHRPVADTVLWDSGIVNTSTAPYIYCSTETAVYSGFQTSKTLVNGISSSYVYQTNNPGIGIQIQKSTNGTNFNYVAWPRSTEQANAYGYRQMLYFRVKLIATGQPVSTGTLDLSAYSADRMFGSARQFLFSFMPTSVQVQSMGCDLQTKDINVPLTSGRGVVITSLSEPGTTTTPTVFDINLNCETTTNISIKFNGTTVSGSQNTLMLDNLEAPSSAQGIGVQILQNGQPINFGEEKTMLNNVNNAAVGLRFQARLIRLSSAIRAGDINATSTFDMIYR